ncbi:MAG: hypothetical protein H7A40_00030 [Chlamydiales bacterium]|nr:hypothetical protein [Chlamydiales bacterium]
MKHVEDFNKWSEQNQNFSLYDYIFQVAKQHSLPEDLFFAYSEVFWPSLCTHNGFVFIQEQYDSSKCAQLMDQHHPVEYWTNFLLLSEFFHEAREYDVLRLAKTIEGSWRAKICQEFPEKDITVTALYDGVYGDCGVTFFQKQYDPFQGSMSADMIVDDIQCRGILKPNIVESIKINTVNGPVSGRPCIRPAWPDEIPKKIEESQT